MEQVAQGSRPSSSSHRRAMRPQLSNSFVRCVLRTPTVRPRVWPTFVAGDPTQLADFDAAVDELGPVRATSC